MKALTPEMMKVVRELQGLVSVSARLRFCATLLAPGEHATALDVRIDIVRAALFSLAGELAAAEVRTAQPNAARIAEVLEQIVSITGGRLHVRNDRLAQVFRLAREGRRLIRSAS